MENKAKFLLAFLVIMSGKPILASAQTLWCLGSVAETSTCLLLKKDRWFLETVRGKKRTPIPVTLMAGTIEEDGTLSTPPDAEFRVGCIESAVTFTLVCDGSRLKGRYLKDGKVESQGDLYRGSPVPVTGVAEFLKEQNRVWTDYCGK